MVFFVNECMDEVLQCGLKRVGGCVPGCVCKLFGCVCNVALKTAV